MTRSAAALVVSLTLLLAGCATQSNAKKDPRDPLERFNRVSYQVTDAVDRAALKPAAKAYKAVAPQFVETGVSNFFSNLAQPTNIVNDLLQAKFKPALNDTGRFLLNTTVGVGGLLDPASKVGLDRNNEDFGQTLGKWGVPAGAFVWIPLLGPYTVRDGIGSVADWYSDPVQYVERDAIRYPLNGLRLVDWRASQLPLEDTLNQAYDKYAFVRNAYLQRREYLVTDGAAAPEAPLDDEPLEDPDPEADKQ
jgi:phospholipid-binding lipoprotein MlaA